MRIEWNGAAAQAVAADLDRIREQLDRSIQRSRTVRRTLDEANEDGRDRRLNAIAVEYEQAMLKLRQAQAEAARLQAGVRTMIDAFEDAEREATRLMNSVETGAAAGDDSGRQGPPPRAIRAPRPMVPPIPMPRPIIGPHAVIGPLGPMPGWLADFIQRHYSR